MSFGGARSAGERTARRQEARRKVAAVGCREQPSPGTRRPVLSLEAVREQQPRPLWRRLAEPPPLHGHSSVEGTLFINTQLAKLTE